MGRTEAHELEFDDEDEDVDADEQLTPGRPAATIAPTDWTTETIVAQLTRRNIDLNPRFQRRDAWKRDRKSRFIESLIVGLPVPQIVLAETKDDRGRFLVLDGKQRLLSISQFWGLGEGPNKGFPLSALPLRPDLKGVSFASLSSQPLYASDYNALCNQSIRTVVIRNWRGPSFLHSVFLRLNTGSVQLSPQELRQALLPGPFSDWVDDAAGESAGLKLLLNLKGPDPRMRDVEILSRFVAFQLFSDRYPGRMKKFLDTSFAELNKNWDRLSARVHQAAEDFELGVEALHAALGEGLAKKPGSPQFNRAIFDALIYFHSRRELRSKLRAKPKSVASAYEKLFAQESAFSRSIESSTAGTEHTRERFRIWGKALSSVTGTLVRMPAIGTTPMTGSKPRSSR